MCERTRQAGHMDASDLIKNTTRAPYKPCKEGAVHIWLLEREYRQHRRLDPTGLPKTFVEWRTEAQTRATKMARLRVGRVVRVVIHPSELETWARQTGRPVARAH